MNPENPDINQIIGPVVLSEEQIQSRIKELAAQIYKDYQDKNPLLVCILRGGFIFTSDLIRNLEIPLAVDFMAVSSYGSSTKSSGVVRILKDLDIDIKGRHVLLIEDVIDTGLTVHYLLRNLKSREPASLEICSLLVKENSNKVINAKYKGFEIPKKFVIGYGLDLDEKYRNLKGIHLLK